MTKISTADYIFETEAARLSDMDVESFRNRWKHWGRGPQPVGTDPRTGERIWVRAIVKASAKARRDGHIV